MKIDSKSTVGIRSLKIHFRSKSSATNHAIHPFGLFPITVSGDLLFTVRDGNENLLFMRASFPFLLIRIFLKKTRAVRKLFIHISELLSE